MITEREKRIRRPRNIFSPTDNFDKSTHYLLYFDSTDSYSIVLTSSIKSTDGNTATLYVHGKKMSAMIITSGNADNAFFTLLINSNRFSRNIRFVWSGAKKTNKTVSRNIWRWRRWRFFFVWQLLNAFISRSRTKSWWKWIYRYAFIVWKEKFSWYFIISNLTAINSFGESYSLTHTWKKWTH